MLPMQAAKNTARGSAVRRAAGQVGRRGDVVSPERDQLPAPSWRTAPVAARGLAVAADVDEDALALACPARLVPPERRVRGSPAAWAPAIRAPASAADAARTTARGVNGCGEASFVPPRVWGASVVTLAGSLTHAARSLVRRVSSSAVGDSAERAVDGLMGPRCRGGRSGREAGREVRA
ncbi:hypothetical protein SANTM175S_03415 [Streptomyces antimycoticus]